MDSLNLSAYPPYTELPQQPPPRKQDSQSLPVAAVPGASPYPLPNTHLLLGPDNTITVCPFCSASIKTAVRYTSNTRTHIAAALCCMICCCCCIPYCSESAKNSDHYCPNCQKYLGTYHK